MFTHTFTGKITTSGNTVLAESSYSGGGQVSLDEPVAQGVGYVAMDVELDLSQIKSLFMNCDQDVTLKTNGVLASGTLTLTGNASNSETVTLGSKVYTFQTSLTDVDGNVLIGATASDTLDNLIAAITLGSGAGTTYAESMTVHTLVTAKAAAGDTMAVTARGPGTASNTVATTETMTSGSFGGATLSGGADTDETVSLLANVPFVWHTGQYFSNVLLTDITRLHVSNSSGTDATFKLEAVYDSTP